MTKHQILVQQARRVANNIRKHAQLLETLALQLEDGNPVNLGELELQVQESRTFMNGGEEVAPLEYN